MQTCKSCKKDLIEGANKCPYCQASQTWYKNPQVYSVLVFFPLLFILYWNLGIFSKKDFLDYKENFSFSQIKVVESNNAEAKLVTFNIQNNTGYKWDTIKYQVISKKDGEFLASYSDISYGWVVQPKSESLLTARIPIVPNANEWELDIKDMDSDRF